MKRGYTSIEVGKKLGRGRGMMGFKGKLKINGTIRNFLTLIIEYYKEYYMEDEMEIFIPPYISLKKLWMFAKEKHPDKLYTLKKIAYLWGNSVITCVNDKRDTWITLQYDYKKLVLDIIKGRGGQVV